MLAYLSRYTHRVAIANRIEGRDRYKQMTLATDEFIRRFLIHVLPSLHRIRHYGLFAKGSCADNIARARDVALRHGISRQLQRTASGSTPHDRLTVG